MGKSVTTMGAAIFGLAAGVYVANKFTRAPYSYRNRVVVITGGSRGLGLVLARQLAAKKALVVILARSASQLRRAEFDLTSHGGRVLAIRCDVREQAQVNSAINEVLRRCGKIDVMINNAGVIQVGPLDTMTAQDFEDALAVHLFGALYTTLAVLPHMRRAGGGRIVNIASIGGKIGLPHMLPYCASKFALVGFSDALRAELRSEGIYVTTVIPGLMRTGSTGNASFKGDHRAEHAWFSVSGSLPLLSANAERAAGKILSACQNGASRLVITMPAKAAALFNELFPDATAALMQMANRFLPSAHGAGNASHLGWESASKLAPSVLTHLSNVAAAQNNELP